MGASKSGSPWPGYVEKAVQEFEGPTIFVYIFSYMKENGHPGIDDHKRMAKSLAAFIQEKIGW
jgi:hypothetical protein